MMNANRPATNRNDRRARRTQRTGGRGWTGSEDTTTEDVDTIPAVFRQVCIGRGWSCTGTEIDIPLDGGRAQRIRIETFTDDEETLLRISTGVGDADCLSESQLRSALGVNAGLAHGALAIRHEQLVLTDTFLAREATPDHVERALLFLATTADRYEKVLFGTDHH